MVLGQTKVSRVPLWIGPIIKKGTLKLRLLSINYVCLEYTGARTDAGGSKPW